MKGVYIVLGTLFGLHTIAQLLQLCGVFGVGFSIAGIGFTLLSGVASFVCFKRAFTPPKQ